MLALEPLEHAPVETEPEEEPVPVEPIEDDDEDIDG